MSKQNEPNESLEAADDELAPYNDLVSALRAPGSASELADEQRFRMAFRETHGASARVVPMQSRMVRRLGAGGSAIIAVVALSSGGVAAALTGNLPDPVQEFAHSVLGAPAPESPQAKTDAPPVIEPLPAPEPTSVAPEESPSAPTESNDPEPVSPDEPSRPVATAEPSQVQPSEVAAPPGPNEEPSPGSETPPVAKPKPAGLTMSGSSHLSPYGGTLNLVGRVTASDGQPIAGRKVVLQVREASGWRRVLKARSDSTGVVAASTSPVTGLDRYRWRVHAPLRSPVWRVRVKPEVLASYAVNGDQVTLSVATVGANPGDPLGLYMRVNKQPTLVREALVGADGTAQFTVPTPKRQRAIVVRLEPSVDHAPARLRLKLTPPPA